MAVCKNGELFPSDFFNQPWIIQCHGGFKHTTTFIDPMKTNVEEKEIGEIKGKLCFGCIDEWLFMWDKQSKECFFLELNSLSKVHLPPLPREFSIMNLQHLPREYSIMTAFSLSSYPNHPDCIVIFTGEKIERRTPFTEEVTEYFVMYCRPHDEKWTKLILYEPSKRKNLLPYGDELITGETCVILNDKLYTYSIFHVIVFDIPSLLTCQVDMRTIKAPMHTIYPLTDMVSTHLVKSCGHVYLVRMYNYERGPIINMDIYCLDTSCDKWSRVDSIGERTFFLSHKCYTSVCAIDAGASCNCIYYVPRGDEDERRIYKFCLDDNTMTFRSILIEQTEHESKFCWFVPRR